MASSLYGAKVDTQLTALSINTDAEVATFRALPRLQSTAKIASSKPNDFSTVHDGVAAAFPKDKAWVSRKRIRHDALRLLREGAL